MGWDRVQNSSATSNRLLKNLLFGDEASSSSGFVSEIQPRRRAAPVLALRQTLAQAALALSRRCRQRPQATDAPQVIRRADQVTDMLCARHAEEAPLPQAPDRLHPTKDLFDIFAQPLAEAIALVSGGMAVQARGTSVTDTGEMGTNPPLPQPTHKVSPKIALVRPHGRGANSAPRLAVQQPQNRVPLRRLRGLGNLQIHTQTMPILHQQMPLEHLKNPRARVSETVFPDLYLLTDTKNKIVCDILELLNKRELTTHQSLALLERLGRTTVGEACRQLGVSEQMFFAWKRKYAGLVGYGYPGDHQADVSRGAHGHRGLRNCESASMGNCDSKRGSRLLPLLLMVLWAPLALSCGSGGSSGSSGSSVTTAACTGSSPTWTSTPDQASVASCISSAASGDTINVSAGSATWSTKVTLDKSISLIGAGVGRTVITDGVSNDNMLAIGAGSTPINPRVSGMTINGSNTSKLNLIATVSVGGISKGLGFRLDHIAFDNILVTGVGTQDSVWGVVDHCTFDMLVNAIGWAIYFTNDRWGDLTLCCGDMAWASPDDFGTEKFVFVEDSTFNPIGPGPTNYIDSVGGARYVIRHNTFNDGFLRAHGTDSTPQQRGTRIVEIYNNAFKNNASTFAEIIELRSGTAVFYDNTSSGVGGFKKGITLKEFRDNANFWPPWGPCDGSTDWDENRTGENGYACLDQPGRGQGDLVTTTSSGISPSSWPRQVLSPVYFWNNTGLRDMQGGSTSSLIQLDRDFFFTPKPGYTAYIYPHPLQ